MTRSPRTVVKEVVAINNERTRYQDRIVRDPDVLVGKPVVKGTRIPVELVLAKLATNPDMHDLFVDYPRLTIDDIKACADTTAAQNMDYPSAEIPDGNE